MTQDTTASAAAAPAGLIFRREIRIEWGNCDPAQIAFYRGIPRFSTLIPIPPHVVERFSR